VVRQGLRTKHGDTEGTKTTRRRNGRNAAGESGQEEVPLWLNGDARQAATKGKFTYVWQNAIRSYLKSLDVLACPSNPLGRSIPGTPGTHPAKPGMNGEGWEVEPEQRMPISYAMNSCTSTWYPADTKEGAAAGPLHVAQVSRPADTLVIAETLWHFPDMHASWMWEGCAGRFSHPAGRMANFIFYDGHVKSKKWLSTLYPLTENNWELQPNPDPANKKINGPPGCNYVAPAGPDAKQYQARECLVHQ
jgi:prepilin-type processing-associated H-X9-DG protein